MQNSEPSETNLQLNECLRRVGDLESRFQPQCVVGSGAMGVVIKARDAFLESDLAIKILLLSEADSEVQKERFAREMRVLANLDHPNIVKIRASGLTTKGNSYYVMDFLNGESLAAIIKEQGRLNASSLKGIIPQVLDGLIYLHENKIVHRDLKPSNIVCVKDDDEFLIPKIIDFGIALNQDSDSVRLTRTSVSVGSPEYMSPEQCRGGRVDEHTDIYAFGCVLFECLSGKVPFTGDTPLDTMYKQMHEAVPELGAANSGSIELVNLVKRCLEKDPAKRPKSMLDVKSEFGRAVETVDTVRMARVDTHGAPRQNPFVGIVVILLLAIPLLFFIVKKSDRERKPSPVSIEPKNDTASKAREAKNSRKLALMYINQLADKSIALQSRMEAPEMIHSRLRIVSNLGDLKDKRDILDLYRLFERTLLSAMNEVPGAPLDENEKRSCEQVIVSARVPLQYYLGTATDTAFASAMKNLLDMQRFSKKKFGKRSKQEVDALQYMTRLYVSRGRFGEAIELMDESFSFGPDYDASMVFVAPRSSFSGVRQVAEAHKPGRASQLILELLAEEAARRLNNGNLAEIGCFPFYIKAIEGLQMFNRFDKATGVIKEGFGLATKSAPSPELTAFKKRLKELESINEKALAKDR